MKNAMSKIVVKNAPWATLLNYGKCSLPIIVMRFKIYDQIYVQHLQVNMAPVSLCYENLAELQQ